MAGISWVEKEEKINLFGLELTITGNFGIYEKWTPEHKGIFSNQSPKIMEILLSGKDPAEVLDGMKKEYSLVKQQLDSETIPEHCRAAVENTGYLFEQLMEYLPTIIGKNP